MKSLQLSLAAALLGALCLQPALAAEKATAASVECEASKPAEPGSAKSRADVKAEAKTAGSVDCEVSKAAAPGPSTKARADVKAQAKTAAKAGEVPQGEAGQVKK